MILQIQATMYNMLVRDSSKRRITFYRGRKIKAPDLIAEGANTLQVFLPLRFIPKVSPGPESHAAHAKAGQTEETVICS